MRTAPAQPQTPAKATPQALPPYAELHCLSNFSFQRGASRPEELVQRAHALGYRALAITDACSMAGVVRAHEAAQACGLHLLIGTEVRVAAPELACGGFTLVLLARNREGYGALCTSITAWRQTPAQPPAQNGRKASASLRRATEQPRGTQQLPCHTHWQAPWPLPAAQARNVLALLAPWRDTTLPLVHGTEPEELDRIVGWLQPLLPGALHLAVELGGRHDDALWLQRLQAAGQRWGMPCVATGAVHMHVRSRKPLQDVMSAIRLGRPLHQCGHALQPNAERHLRSRLQLARLYPPELLQASVQLAESCQFRLTELRYEYPQEVVPAGHTAHSYLHQSVRAGAQERYPEGVPEAVQRQLDHELALIAELGYENYFLTVYDLVRFARSRGILCQGRGSAANSAVCYCLGITAVDPARASVLFERFISRERNEPPDIDVDFEHQRREEVIQYLYQRYGRDRAALAAAVATYQPRSALRDVGKALGWDPEALDRLARHQGGMYTRELQPERLQEGGLELHTRPARLLLELAGQLLGFPRHLSQHSGGFVLTGQPLIATVPVVPAAMAGRTTIEWDKDDLEALGLMKVDVLALGMLSALHRGLDLVASWRGRPMALTDIPPEDPATYSMICRADTVGVFQIESRAQMSMLPRLQPRCFYDLVVEVAIVRPGPIQGGMVHPYLKARERQRQGEPMALAKEALRPALERTLGVPIFQEQVMQLAIIAAGFTPGEADALRRAMAAWRRKGGVDRFHQRVVQGMVERGYDSEFAEAIFRQIQGFGEYGFPESHAASFALLVYASAWIKCHEPACFLAALLNSQPMGFYTPSQLVQDAQRHSVEVRPADVLHSHWECTLEPALLAQPQATPAVQPAQPAVRLGLCLVQGLSREGAERLVQARLLQPHTAWRTVDDVARAARLNRADVKALAAADALASLAGHRRQQVWQASAWQPARDLLQDAPQHEATLALPEAPEGEAVVQDYAHLGLSLRSHPLALLRPQLRSQRLQSARELAALGDGRLVRACGLVTTRQRPATAKGTMFVTLEDETGCVQVVVWKDLRERQRLPLLHAQLLAVYGRWQVEGHGEHAVRHLIAGHLADLSHLLGTLQVASRNFR